MSLKKITENKKDFSIEKIASAIHAEYLISSLKNKYIDPLILYRRKKAKRKQRNLSESSNEDSFSLNKMLVHKLMKPKNDEDKLDLNITKTVLPIITPSNKEEIKSNNLLITSGMFKQKEFLKNNFQKIKLGNVMNFKNHDSIYQNLYPKIENPKKMNDKYNLNLDLKFYQEEKPKIKNSKRKSVAQKNLMNYLFKKFIMNSEKNNNIESRESSKNNENIINPTANNLFKLNESAIKKKKSFTIDEIIQKRNINNILLKGEDNNSKNAFITRIPIKKNRNDEPNENIKKNDIILKPRKRVFSYLFDENNNIIKHDQKVFVDCLYSEIISNLDKNKIIYNPIGKVKTNYAITKEPSYKKIKKFETMIDNIIKTPKDLSITANQ
jgi:hypothetical protein